MKEIQFSFVDKNLSEEHKAILAPKRQSELASGLDLVAANAEPIVLLPMARVLVPTGIIIHLMEGMEGQVRGRSGLAWKHGLMVLNAPGTIDADYRGEIKVILANMSAEPFTVEFGMRVAQLVIMPVLLPKLVEVNESGVSKRGDAGFGSTGLSA